MIETQVPTPPIAEGVVGTPVVLPLEPVSLPLPPVVVAQAPQVVASFHDLVSGFTYTITRS